MEQYLDVSPQVRDALASGQPVVAFETTILSFGLPVPLNLEVALAAEQAAREEGAVPATLGILNGRVRVGLTLEEIEFFCSRDASIRKVNLQNFAGALASGGAGALTVSGSMRACAMAGIRIFATGGIGGIHRGFAATLDISSDLKALASYPVAVVCAGAKSVLDVPATLEALETLGVPVVGHRTTAFPLFFAAESDFELEITFNEIEPIARFIKVHCETADGGVLVANPVPAHAAVPTVELERWINSAIAEAQVNRITGKQVTPFLLDRLEQFSGGQTLEANRSLVENNARLASRLSAELLRLCRH
jgi:pseudouridylate synthase